MNFGKALELLKEGHKVQRTGWNGKGMWIELNKIEKLQEGVPEKLDYLKIIYPVGHSAYLNGCDVPWLASQTDILAEDWCMLVSQK